MNRDAEHFDVVIVGAGVSGLGSAFYLQRDCPDRSFVILESQENFGGTWATHRYPGIRTDSDIFSYAYAFKPWTGPLTASATDIRAYLADLIAERNLASHIRYRHRVTAATWSSSSNRWTLEATDGSGGARRFTANFLWMCQGYYDHAKGYTPTWDGMDEFKGQIVHPQTWPQDLDYKGKRIVVVGSGATAATLIPAIAEDSAHVVMLQRSPTYYTGESAGEDLLKELRALDIDPFWIHEIMRRRKIRDEWAFVKHTFNKPEAARSELIEAARAQLPEGYDVDAHFTPRYRPWQQRLAFVPNNDFFAAIRSGKVSVETDGIERFTPRGIMLASGKTLDADIIVTATGFNMSILGGAHFVIDGEPLALADTVTYQGAMFTGVPNLAWVFGYLRASWTPRVDLIGEFVCRLINHMKRHGYSRVTPRLRQEDADMPLLPWIDADNFSAGYLMRSVHLLPRRGPKPEWQHTQDIMDDMKRFPEARVDGEALLYA